MNIAHAGAAGLAAALAFALGALQPGPGIDATTTSSVSPQAARGDSFRLVSTWGGTNCSISADHAPEGTPRPLVLAPGCLADTPELAGARYWLDRPDGTFVLSGIDGRVIAEFAAADGAAFESYSPPLPVMTLFSED